MPNAPQRAAQPQMTRRALVEMFLLTDTTGLLSYFFSPTGDHRANPSGLDGSDAIPLARARLTATILSQAMAGYWPRVADIMSVVRQQLQQVMGDVDRQLVVADRYLLNANVRQIQRVRHRQGPHTPLSEDMADADENGAHPSPYSDPTPDPIAEGERVHAEQMLRQQAQPPAWWTAAGSPLTNVTGTVTADTNFDHFTTTVRTRR